VDLRVTLQTMIQRALANTRRQTDRLGVLQEQAVTGKKIEAPSDDPPAYVQLLGLRTSLGQLSGHLGNVQVAEQTLEAQVASLRQVSDILSKARQLGQEALHGSNDKASLQAIAMEIETLLERMADQANQKHLDRFLFSGASVQTMPFEVIKDDHGRIIGAKYHGSTQEADVPVGLLSNITTLISGDEIFESKERQKTFYTGRTGAKAGTGTDSGTGLGRLSVRHVATTYALGSGVQPGASSAAKDSIIGPLGAHNLRIIDDSGTGAFGRVSLNGGGEIAFTNADVDLKVVGPNGEVVYVDMSAIVPGFNGTVAIQSDGEMSIDDGATWSPIAFVQDQILADSRNGAVTHVDSREIRRVGVDEIEYIGAFDAFEALVALRDDVLNKRELSAGENAQALSRRMAELERIHNHVLQLVGEQSARLATLDGLKKQYEDKKLLLEKAAAEVEGADLVELAIKLQEQQTLLASALAATARVLQVSLLDFLR